MRKNQKYTQEEMYMAIELWKESGISQKNYCKQNNLSYNTFKYWLNKYHKDRQGRKSGSSKSFIPVHIPQTVTAHIPEPNTGMISINYPNGVVLNCPVDISVEQLRGLINL